MSMLSTIKKAGVGAVQAGNPVNVLFGTVTKTSPLEVNVDQRFTLPADLILVPESLTRYEVELQHNHSHPNGTTGDALTTPIVIREGLQPGDKVILIRVQGGQKYVVMDKVVSL